MVDKSSLAIDRKYGWKPQKKDKRDYKLRTTKLKLYENLPKSVDVSVNIDKVLDQANTSSCVPHSFVEGARFARMKQGLAPIDLSRLFIYYNTRVIEDDVNEDGGAELRDCMKSVATQGCPDEREWPFVYENLFKKPHDNVYKDALQNLIGVYAAVGQTENELKQCLADGYPFLFGTDLVESFESDEVARTGIVPTPNWGTDHIIGGHALTCVGYNDDTRMFKILNHWGADWGDKGYCYMSYDYILNKEHTSDFWTLRELGYISPGRKVFVPKAAKK